MTDHDLKVVLAGIQASLQRLEEKLSDLTDANKEIKSAIWDPSKGLYAMTAAQDAEIKSLKQQLATYSKGLWIAGSTIIGLVAKTIIDLI